MNFNSKWAILAAVSAFIILIGGGFFYLKSHNFLNQTIPQNQNTQGENKKVIAEIGKLIELPTGEEPTVATITDISKLKKKHVTDDSKQVQSHIK